MSLKTAIKRLERELRPADDVILYFPTGLEENEEGGMVKVINWSRPGWEEFITPTERDQRLEAFRQAGGTVVGPGY